MGKQIVRRSIDPNEDSAGLDLLRNLANYPHRTVLMNKHQTRSRITLVNRDNLGRIIGSTERIEETEVINVDGAWSD